MTTMEEVLDRVSQMPDDERDRFAKVMLAELESEEKWDRLFESSQDLLKEMADEAVRELDLGKTKSRDRSA